MVIAIGLSLFGMEILSLQLRAERWSQERDKDK